MLLLSKLLTTPLCIFLFRGYCCKHDAWACQQVTAPELAALYLSKPMSLSRVSAVSISTCLLTTCRYYKEAHPDGASEMLVNSVEFNNRLPTHAELKLQVLVTGGYNTHIKTTTKNNMNCRDPQIHKDSHSNIHTNVFQMCVIVSVSWSTWQRQAVI